LQCLGMDIEQKENRHRTARVKLFAAVVGWGAVVAMVPLSIVVVANTHQSDSSAMTRTVPEVVLTSPTISTSTPPLASPVIKAVPHWGQPPEP